MCHCFFNLGNSIGTNKNEAALQAKISGIVKKMTLEEKIGMLHGNALFSSGGVKRLGIPELTCDDGPSRRTRRDQEVRLELGRLDNRFCHLYAQWIGHSRYLEPRNGLGGCEEANARKKDIMLAAAFNICRMPLCGRTYEYYSEDPYLNAQNGL